ncbi:hypothetical protein KP509_07G080200 [Ceratopteris richardii]|uniref:RING-type domain-containing protein n=1 Tax=Ceratopteris richardii TaxID=49495 RepID=A0A8T2UJK5_CERRI|nr:hypothetical protein KP509_1Z164800 [Ceratopteris richardii]KAH6556916.1 hypothetical protein KP509_1Z148000 [Ceratopteris richardii]KAH7433665.1 hypothetical protein KP509_07G080200 [Ceratopteris richardii]
MSDSEFTTGQERFLNALPFIFISVWLAFVALFFFNVLKSCIVWIIRTGRTSSDLPTHEEGGRPDSANATVVSTQRQTVTLEVGESDLEERSLRRLPDFENHHRHFEKVPPDRRSTRLLHSSTASNNSFRDAQSSGDQCVMCLSQFQQQDRVRILPTCGHPFHVVCFNIWFESHACCPVCRQDIPPHAIHEFLTTLEVYCADVPDTDHSLVPNEGARVLSGVDNLVNGDRATDS